MKARLLSSAKSLASSTSTACMCLRSHLFPTSMATMDASACVRSSCRRNEARVRRGVGSGRRRHHGDRGWAGGRNLEPALAVLEALALRDVIHQQRADRATVVGGGDRSIPLLPGRVPHLRLDGLAIVLNLPRREIDADGAFGVVMELVAREPTQQTRLAHARVALRSGRGRACAGAAGGAGAGGRRQACAASTRAGGERVGWACGWGERTTSTTLKRYSARGMFRRLGSLRRRRAAGANPAPAPNHKASEPVVRMRRA